MPVEDPVFSGDQVRHDRQKSSAVFEAAGKMIREYLTMVLFLLILQAVLVSVLVFFTICFLIASLTEKEFRAALMAGAVIFLMIGFELFIYWFYTLGFFFSPAGVPLLLTGWVVAGYGIYFFAYRPE